MRVRVLVEGPSEEAFLARSLRRYKPRHYFQIIPHQGKGKMPNPPTRSVEPRRQGLLDQLPATPYPFDVDEKRTRNLSDYL